ncbi:MAG: sigma-54 dependent transcriptional regulator [Bacteroidales bacterium]|nr:sigma-54 dependent transcriptional regulator [Bacteroidales bacterium]
MDLNQIKQRFGIIGSDPELERALEIAVQVAPTNLSVLVTGESGVGKEVIPQVIHQYSARKHGPYLALNCGGIPEGTIDSELFGHEKGSFTGAIETRKGYFEEADGGTLFLDEVAELPLSTQVRLLRVLQTGEFIKVGSAKVQKTNVRVVAATNVNLQNAIRDGKFREDLYYRLCTVPISVPPLRVRKNDIPLLFKKFALDFADQNMVPAVRLTPEAQALLQAYRWPGNVRQLQSVVGRISVLETTRLISAETLSRYLPSESAGLPVRTGEAGADYLSDRDIIFKILYQMRQDIERIERRLDEGEAGYSEEEGVPRTGRHLLISPESVHSSDIPEGEMPQETPGHAHPVHEAPYHETVQPLGEEPVSIQDVSAELIRKALERNGGRRKKAAEELGISERTLYRKIKELGIQ